MEHDNEPAWSGSVAQKKAKKYLWNALKHSYPDQLALQLRAGVEQGLFSADEALVFPLRAAMDKPLASLAHSHPQWPDHTRDQRLAAWFQSALEIGAQPQLAARMLSDRASSAMVRLMKMKAIQSLDWWRGHGIGERLPGIACLGGENANLATLAFVHGQAHYLDIALAHGDALEHPGKLWTRVWTKPCLVVSDVLLSRLMKEHGAPPPGAMSWWAGAWVNKNNIESVLKSGERLVQAGADVNAAAPGMMPAIGVAVGQVVSPSSARVVQFLLDQGADATAEFDLGHEGHTVRTCALDLALHRWIKTSLTSALRQTVRQNFLALAGTVPAHVMVELYPPERRAGLIEKLRDGANEDYTREDVAMLEQAWMRVGVDRPSTVASPRGPSRL